MILYHNLSKNSKGVAQTHADVTETTLCNINACNTKLGLLVNTSSKTPNV